MFEINNKAKEKIIARQKAQREASVRIGAILNAKGSIYTYGHMIRPYGNSFHGNTVSNSTSQGIYVSMMMEDMTHADNIKYGG